MKLRKYRLHLFLIFRNTGTVPHIPQPKKREECTGGFEMEQSRSFSEFAGWLSPP
jgi:hypothetical protein